MYIYLNSYTIYVCVCVCVRAHAREFNQLRTLGQHSFFLFIFVPDFPATCDFFCNTKCKTKVSEFSMSLVVSFSGPWCDIPSE